MEDRVDVKLFYGQNYYFFGQNPKSIIYKSYLETKKEIFIRLNMK